jgi:Protein of unknown function (DUF3021).
MDVDMNKNNEIKSGLKKKCIILCLIGFVVGIIISLFIGLFCNSPDGVTDYKVSLIQLIGSGLFGIISMGGSIVYQIENWSLRRATVSHYFITMIAFLVANEVLGWFGRGVILLIVFLAMSVIYLIIWFVEYSLYKRRVDEMNKDLQAFTNGRQEDEHL